MTVLPRSCSFTGSSKIGMELNLNLSLLTVDCIHNLISCYNFYFWPKVQKNLIFFITSIASRKRLILLKLMNPFEKSVIQQLFAKSWNRV